MIRALPVAQLHTAMPSIVPTSDASRIGYNQAQAAFAPGSTGPLQIVTSSANAATVRQIASTEPEIAALMPTQTHIAAVDAERMLSIVDNDDLALTAGEVRRRLSAVVDRAAETSADSAAS